MKLTRLIAFGLGSALALLVGNTLVSHRNTLQIAENDRWVSHTHRVLAELTTTLSTVKDAETGQRGYLLTGKNRYLVPYQEAVASVNQEASSLKQLITDNPQQQQRVQGLEQSIAIKAELQNTIDLQRTQGVAKKYLLQPFLRDDLGTQARRTLHWFSGVG